MKEISSPRAWIITIRKSFLGAIFNELNRQHCNKFLQREGTPQSIQFHSLWHGPNGPMVIFLEIIAFLSILEPHYNG
jgi:hypothetical protein